MVKHPDSRTTGPPAPPKVSTADLERAIGVLADVSATEASLDGRDRDEIGHVIHMLETIAEKR